MYEEGFWYEKKLSILTETNEPLFCCWIYELWVPFYARRMFVGFLLVMCERN